MIGIVKRVFGEHVDWNFTGGAAQVVDGALAVKITQSGGFTYIGESLPGTAEATASWRAQRISSSGTTVWADGDSDFNNVATDLTGLSYS